MSIRDAMQLRASCTAAFSDVQTMQQMLFLLGSCVEHVCTCASCSSSAVLEAGQLNHGTAVQLQTSQTLATAAM
jgi:hypothetical protein